MSKAAGPGRVEKVVTSGTFSLDGGTWEVDSNVWVLGDDTECIIVDAARDAHIKAVNTRKVVAVLLTHGHDDHITAVGEVSDATRGPSYLHPDDRMLWDVICVAAPDHALADGDVFTVGEVDLHVLHTPGHSRGACCFHARSSAWSSAATPSSMVAGGDRAVVQRLPNYRRLDPDQAADASARDCGPHRHGDDTRSATRRRIGRSGSPAATKLPLRQKPSPVSRDAGCGTTGPSTLATPL